MSTPETEPAAPAAMPPPAADAPPSPGALLRQARERAGLGAEDLAGQLKLAKGTLEALERDDFAALSEPVYVRGYYRKIAKVLPVAENELINAYNARLKPPQSTPAMRRLPLAGGVAAGASRNARGPGIGLVIGAVILVGVLIALMTREPPRRLAGAGPAAAPASTTPAAEAPAVAVPAAQPQPLEETALPAPAAAASPPGQLVLELSEASYVRVDDSQGRTLKIGLVHAGERQALDGAPPYTVFLGNPHHVRVFLGGQPVDFSAHITPDINTARFTVP
jgi:cytoskeleton protein RodZ